MDAITVRVASRRRVVDSLMLDFSWLRGRVCESYPYGQGTRFRRRSAGTAVASQMTRQSLLHFEWALLPRGWARDVSISLDEARNVRARGGCGGRRTAPESSIAIGPAGPRQRPQSCLPARDGGPHTNGRTRPRVPSGPGATRCIASLDGIGPEGIEAVTAQALRRDARGRAFTRVGRVPLPAPRPARGARVVALPEWRARVAGGGGGHRHRAHAPCRSTTRMRLRRRAP